MLNDINLPGLRLFVKTSNYFAESRAFELAEDLAENSGPESVSIWRD